MQHLESRAQRRAVIASSSYGISSMVKIYHTSHAIGRCLVQPRGDRRRYWSG